MPFKPGQSGNPAGRKPKSVTQASRLDGWASTLTSLGTSRDKRTSVGFATDVVTDVEARELWRGDDLCARAVEAYPDEMLRAGYDVSVQASDEADADGAREQSEAIEEALKRLGADEALRTALCYERAYGGGALFPVINDSAGDLSLPLNEAQIPEIRRLVVFEPRELQARRFYSDPLDDKYGTPVTYTLTPIGVQGGESMDSATWREIHESRLIVFPGKRVTRAQLQKLLPGWGDSTLTLVRETIRDFNAGFASVSVLMQDFAQAVLWVSGLNDAIAADETGLIKGKLATLDMSRSVLRAMLLDAGDGSGKMREDFERKSTPLTGVSDVLDRMIYRLAAALEIPAAMLMGMSPGGLNATGDADTRHFYDRVARAQDRHLRPRLEHLIRLVMLSKAGPTKGTVPDKWCVEFCPLWQSSQKEVIDARFVQAQTDEKYVNLGVVSPDDVTKSRFGGDGYSYETKVDLQALERVRAAEEERANAMAAAAAKAALAPKPAPGDAPPPAADPNAEPAKS